MPDDRDELDRLLDSALAGYGDPGGNAGLEDRILSRIAAEGAPAPRQGWVGWAIATPVAAGILLFVMLWRPATKTVPVVPQQAQITSQLSAVPLVPKKQAVARAPSTPRAANPLHKLHSRRVALDVHPAPLPKLDVFPTPRPLTKHEQALAVYVARMPQAERQSLARAQQSELPITVASMHSLSKASIPALTVDSIPTLPFESPDAISLGPRTQDEN